MKNDTPLSLEEALDIILSSTPSRGTVKVALRDALGRVLAEDIHADEDLPPFNNSAMDGYAVIAEDTRGASKDNPRKLKVIAEAPAGTVVTQQIVPGTAVRIMTGAPVPDGADAVVMVEETESRDSEVLIYRETKQGFNIRPSGEDVRRDELVIQAGKRIRPSEVGMLAALGKAEVTVFRKPRVAIITSGNELVDASEHPGPGQIRDSNQYSLFSQVLNVGAEVSVLNRVIDEKEEMERVLSSAVETSDLIIASGGVSVGDYDFVKETLAKLGDIRFWKVEIKPGKPTVYGSLKGKPLFGLPGNPVSSMVTFDLFVRPAIMRMMGIESAPYKMVSGAVTQDIRHKLGRREFIRATTTWSDDGYIAAPTGMQGSGRLSSMVNANSYIIVPEEMENVAAGENLQVILFE